MERPFNGSIQIPWLQIYCGDAAHQIRQAQELEASVRHDFHDVDYLTNDLVADRFGYELHRTPSSGTLLLLS